MLFYVYLGNLQYFSLRGLSFLCCRLNVSGAYLRGVGDVPPAPFWKLESALIEKKMSRLGPSVVKISFENFFKLVFFLRGLSFSKETPWPKKFLVTRMCLLRVLIFRNLSYPEKFLVTCPKKLLVHPWKIPGYMLLKKYWFMFNISAEQ